MAEHSTLTSLFSDIADSIRAKTGENRVLIADNFPTEIDAIPTPVPPDIKWARPSNYPDLDSLTYPDGVNEMYFTIDRTKGKSSTDYIFEIQKDNDDESLTFGHIENGTYVADTNNLMAGGAGTKTIGFADYPSNPIFLGKFSYSGTSNIQATKVFNPCIIESYVNWAGASNDGQLLFVGENLKYIKFICYKNTSSSILGGMFSGCYSLQSIDFGNNFDTSSVTDMQGMFYDCYLLQSINFGNNFDASNVTTMNSMFSDCYSLQSLDLSTFYTSSVTEMWFMFYNCYSLQTIDFGDNFDTSNVTTMNGMFSDCCSLQSINFGNKFDTSNVTDMTQMFYNCSSLQSLDLSNFNTSKVTMMPVMFSGCSSLQSLDLSTFNTSSVTVMQVMFQDCYSLQSIYFGNNFDTSNADMGGMFEGCNSLQHRTFIDIMNILPEVATTQTLNFYISKYKVDPEDIAIGTEKGWTITLSY